MRPPFLTSSKTTPAGNRQYLLVLTGRIHLTGYFVFWSVNKYLQIASAPVGIEPLVNKIDN